MLSRELELGNGASQNVGDRRKSPAILTASEALDSPLELSSPAIFEVSKGQDVPKDFPKGRPFEVSLQDSPDTIAYERTMSAIYDSYGRDRESKVDARISVHATTLPSHLTAQTSFLPVDPLAPSVLEMNDRTGGQNGTSLLAVPSLLSSNTLHHTVSRQSFASNTDLLSHPDHRSTSMAQATPSAQSDTEFFDHTSKSFHYQEPDLGANSGRIQQRTVLRRQGTDDCVTSVVTYNQNQTASQPSGLHVRNDSMESGFKESHVTEVKSDSKPPDEGYGLAATTEHGQLDALRRARGWRRWFPDPKWGFLILVIAETVINIGIEGNILFRFSHAIDSNTATSIVTQNKVRLPVYLSIFAMAHVFQLLLAIDATIFRNTIQIIGLSIFNGLFLVYAVIQMDEIKEILGTAQDGSEITGETAYSILHVSVAVQTATILGVIAAAEVGFIVLSWFIYKDFGWEIYKDLGADLGIKRYYLHHQIFVCVIRFASFFFVGFGVQFIFLVLPQSDPEYYVTIAALPVSILLLLTGAVGAHFENVWAMGGFLIGMLGGLGYFVFKTYRIYNQREMYHQVYKSLTTFAGLSMLILAVSLIWACIVMNNFGKGLREQRVRAKVRKGKRRGNVPGKESSRSPVNGQHELEVVRRRMTLD